MQRGAFKPDVQTYDRQRKWPRRGTQFTVVVKYDKTIQTASMVDVSLGGMQIKGVGGMRRGTTVEVQLVTGETYRGTAAWSTIDRVGLMFQRPLSVEDRLFRASGRIMV